jgi:hypothetical protein
VHKELVFLRNIELFLDQFQEIILLMLQSSQAGDEILLTTYISIYGIVW